MISKFKFYLLYIINPLLNLLFPIRCLGCESEGLWICTICTKKIVPKEFQLCPICKNKKNNGTICNPCANSKDSENIYFDRLIIAANYDKGQLIQKIVKTFKYRLISDLNAYLGEMIYEAIIKNLSEFKEYILIAVPLHPKRQKWRGFNQSELLAEYMSSKLKIPLLNKIIKRTKSTKSQANLNREERLVNLTNAFTVKDKSQMLNKKIILIDDITTTLSTLNQCAKVIKEAGAKEIICVVIGRGK